MIKLAICDDSPAVIEQIEAYLEQIQDLRFNYEVFFSAEELYDYKITQQIDFDIYLLDIELGTMSGLELAKKIRQVSPYALIIFLTSYTRYVLEVFEVITFDFIEKPLSYERFKMILHKASDFLRLTKVDFIFSYRKNSYSIPCQRIIYIEKTGRKAHIYTNYGSTYQCNITLDEIWTQLNPKTFASIHTSCIVNLNEILEVVCDKLTLKNGKVLYVARNYRQEIKHRHLQYLKERL